MEKLMRMSLPLDMANTPDEAEDFLIRVIRLKVEDLEGEIISRNKKLDILKVALGCGDKDEKMKRDVAIADKIVKKRIKDKKALRNVLFFLQRHGLKTIIKDRSNESGDVEAGNVSEDSKKQTV